MTGRRRVPVLWLLEHVAREMDAACAVAATLRARHGLDLEIRHVYRDARALIDGVLPDVVVHPVFYFVAGALATEDYVGLWPEATHFNLAWEQLHYSAHRAVKAPADDFARRSVLHHAWGPFYRDYLLAHGVPDEHVFVNGHPAYQLYEEPYRRNHATRDELAAAHGLDTGLRWVFVPENYRWAFVSDKRIDTVVSWGGRREELVALRAYSQRALSELLAWCQRAGASGACEVIFRTRPATGEDVMRAWFAEHVGRPSSRLRFIKERSVRDWTLGSDLVVSSYSTSLIEAALAGRPAYMAEPLPLPPSLECDWYAHVPRLKSAEAFEAACLGGGQGSAALAAWARAEMLGRGDPIVGLADRLAQLVAQRPGRTEAEQRALEARCAQRAARVPPRQYFNEATHDHDDFDDRDVSRRVARWAAVLGHGARASSAP